MTDEMVVICPKCGSSEIETRNHEQLLQKAGGVLLSSAGAAAGTVGGAASGASIGAAIGTVAGPLGVIMGGTIGTFVGAISVGITGGFLGHRFGKKAGVMVDQNIYLDYVCKKCKHRFNMTTNTNANQKQLK
ncbi:MULTISPECIES: hypothetical protein [Acinetobacter]|uniref:Glycine zipper domain-containing protein n=1 Tax=Acinetobacter piscicola TaxID=2006115 RepID=A0A7S7AGI2_9GAMM|nr:MULTISPECIES: hypothetical protein [Acinetobacter]QOW44931.1 hypothetical protein G0028_02895 [Acinetobacter piscicola]